MSAVKMRTPEDSANSLTYGRQFDHEKKLYSKLSRESIDALKAYFKDEMDKELGNDGWQLVVKMNKVCGILCSLHSKVMCDRTVRSKSYVQGRGEGGSECAHL